MSTRSIERTLKTLQKQGALVRQGPDKGGQWQVRYLEAIGAKRDVLEFCEEQDQKEYDAI